MKMLRAVLAEAIGLFVDDWAFAALVASWVALFSCFGHRLTSGTTEPVVFVLGIAALVMAFVYSRAKNISKPK